MMVCLASTTWAWFSVSIENKGNEIQIAAATVEVKVNDTTLDANGDSCTVNAGAHTVAVKRTSYDGNKPVYVVLAVKSSASEGTENTELNYYWIQAEPEETKKTLTTDKTADISYALSWVEPNAAQEITAVSGEELDSDSDSDDESGSTSESASGSESGSLSGSSSESSSGSESEDGVGESTGESTDGTESTDSGAQEPSESQTVTESSGEASSETASVTPPQAETGENG